MSTLVPFGWMAVAETLEFVPIAGWLGAVPGPCGRRVRIAAALLISLVVPGLAPGAPRFAPAPAVLGPPAWVAATSGPRLAPLAILTNGDFETGAFGGWTVWNQIGSAGSWSVYTGTIAPQSGYTIAPPPQGAFAATTDETGPGSHILFQDVALEPTSTHELRFTLYYQNRAAAFFTPATLDAFGSGSNQQYRVDIMNPAAPEESVAPGDVLANVFQTAVGDPLSLQPTVVTFDLTPFVGQTVRIRFASVQNVYYFQASVDDVSIVTTSLTHTITAGASPNGSITPSGHLTVPEGAHVDFTIAPDPCYRIADVVVDGSSVGPVPSYAFDQVTADHTISASFALGAPFMITASAGAGGGISPSGTVSLGCADSQAFAITPAPCFRVADVQVDGSSVGSVSAYTFAQVGADHTIAASFVSAQGGFVDVGTAWGVAPPGEAVGVAWGDYDGDADQDLYIVNYFEPNKLYRNDGGGVFTDVSASSHTDDTGNGSGAAWGDYDNDGDLDLYVTNHAGNVLYGNDGDGTFTDVTAASGTQDGLPAIGVAWGDYDRDGDLDLYVVNEGANKLYRNNGDGAFTDVSAATGTDDPGPGRGVAWGDYDNDGDLDLYVGNLGSANKLYRNNGDGTFTDVSAASHTDDAGRTTGVAWGDYDNDGDLDLYIGNEGGCRLFRNDGGGVFTDVTAVTGTGGSGGRGVAWGDYDNDGNLDLYVAVSGPNRLFRNTGAGTFTDEGPATGTNDPGDGYGAAWADADGDGDLDLYTTSFYGEPNRLYRNERTPCLPPPAGHWVEVSLVGVSSNRWGIGARVRVVAGGQSRIRDVSGGSGGSSENSLVCHFGLGTAPGIDSLIVRWPSGIVQVVCPVPSLDQRVNVVEAPSPSGPQPVFDAASSGPGGVHLSWLDVPGANQYLVYRDGNLVATLPANTVQFDDPSPLTGTSIYCIEAAQSCGISTQRCVPLTYPCSPAASSWARRYGPGPAFEDVVILPEGGYAAVGWGQDVILTRVDPDGNLLWQKTIGTASVDAGYGLTRIDDGGFVIAGRSKNVGLADAWLIRCDSSGDTLWTRTYGGSGAQFFGAVATTPDGGLILSGGSAGRLWLVKTDAQGDQIWARLFFTGATNSIFPTGVVLASDGGFALAGRSWLIKTDSLGAQAWVFEWTAGFHSVAEYRDGGFIVAGYDPALGAGGAIRVDAEGNYVWSYEDDPLAANAALPAADGGAWIAGERCCGIEASVASLVRLDGSGLESFSHQESDSGYSTANALKPTADGGFIMAGRYARLDPIQGFAYLVKRDCSEPSNLVTVPEPTSLDLRFALDAPYPNPARSAFSYAITLPAETQVQVGIYDLTGRLVRQLVDQRLPAGRHRLGWRRAGDAGGMKPAVYFLRLRSPAASVVHPIVLLE